MLSWTEKYSHPTSMTNLLLLTMKFTWKWSIGNCLTNHGRHHIITICFPVGLKGYEFLFLIKYIYIYFFKYRLILQAKDMGSPPLTGTCTVRVQVVDVNDNSPTIPFMEPVTIAESMKLIYVY